MTRARVLAMSFIAVLGLGGAPRVDAMSADGAGASLVVPFVRIDATTNTAVFIENHEPTNVDVTIRWVGEPSSATPGLRICKPVTLRGNSLTALRFLQACSLSGPDELGMVVVIATKAAGLVRLSARGRVDVFDPTNGERLQTLWVDGLPLAALEGSDAVHVATGLGNDPLGANGPPLTTDCLVGTLFDGSGAGGALVRFGLRDRDDQPLGTDVYSALAPFTLRRFRDAFRVVGAPPVATGEARAVFALGGAGDAVIAYCVGSLKHVASQGETLTLAVAQVAEPVEETRRRSISVTATPEVHRGADFRIDPRETRVVHGLFVRHPDRLSCSVAATDALVVKLVSPDRASSLGGVTSWTGWVDTGPRGTIARGFAGLWGLEVSWNSSARRTAPVRYAISCRSGNGVSLADELFRN